MNHRPTGEHRLPQPGAGSGCYFRDDGSNGAAHMFDPRRPTSTNPEQCIDEFTALMLSNACHHLMSPTDEGTRGSVCPRILPVA